MANQDKLVFPIGFDLEDGVKQVKKEWENTYHKQLQNAIGKKPLKVKLELDTKALGGLDLDKLKAFKQVAKDAATAAQENAKIQKANISVSERQAIAEERIAAAHERTRAAAARRKKVEQGLNSTYKTQLGYLQRLSQRMAAYASVAYVRHFLRNVREITAEFELQRTALGAIIGDANRANLLFEQIKAAAVKSPFEVKELVTYTKQLAAYKIETEELFETTQRLGDISAGIGVSMDRLILAYGQIRATGYLRASEVRQLTEAGIPIVEELAKKMSALKQETVSAADVMQLISERAISFKQVKEVFDDMTSAGGMFYKMQEIQSETLRGQINNLKDAFSIMYDEIGRSEGVNSTMSSMIALTKSLAQNWRTVGAVASTAIVSFLGVQKVIKPIGEVAARGIYARKALDAYRQSCRLMQAALSTGDKDLEKEAKNLEELAKGYRKTSNELRGFGGALKSLGNFLKTNIWGLVAAGVFALISYFRSARKEAERLNEELSKIGTEGALQADQSVRKFERLAEVVKKSVDGSKEQKDALAELKREYGDFLPLQDKQIVNLLRERDGYQEVSQAIREKIDLQIKEQKFSRVTSEYGEELSKTQDAMRKALKDAGLSRDEISQIFNEIEKGIKDGIIKLGDSSLDQSLTNVINKVTGLNWSVFDMYSKTGQSFWGTSYIIELVEHYTELEEKLKDIESEHEANTNSLGKYKGVIDELKKDLGSITSEFEEGTFAYDEDVTEKSIKFYQKAIQKLWEMSDFDKNSIAEGILGDFDAMMEVLEEKVPDIAGIVRKIRGEYKDLFPDSEAATVRSSILSVAAATGISMDKAKGFMKGNNQDIEDWKKNMKSEMEDASKSVMFYSSAWKYALKNNLPQAGDMKVELDDAKKMEDFLKELDKIWKFSTTKTRGSGRKQKPAWIVNLENQMKFMEDFQKGVEKMSKTMGKANALLEEQNNMLYRGTALGIKTGELKGTEDELIAWYEKTIKEVAATIRKGNAQLAKKTKSDEDYTGILEFVSTHQATKEGQKLLDALMTALSNFKTDKASKALEAKLKDLSNEISRTKAAKEFFDKMMGLTGDKDLSATLTMNVYGVADTKDFSKTIATNMQEQIKTYFGTIDISSAIDAQTQEINYPKLLTLLDKNTMGTQNYALAFKLINDMIDGNAKYIESLYDSYDKFLTFEERKTIVAKREAEERAKIKANTTLDEKEEGKLMEASKKRESEEKLKIDIEEFKAGKEYVKVFENIENLSKASIKRLLELLDGFMKKNASALAENPEQMKALMDEYKKLYDGLIAKDPWKAVTAGLKEHTTAIKKVADARKKLKDAEEAENTAAIAEAQKELNDALDERVKATNKVVQGMDAIAGALNSVGSILTDIVELIGIAEDSEVNAFIQEIVKWLGVMATVLTTITAIITVIQTLGAPFLGIMVAIAAVAATITYLVNGPIRKANAEIEKQEKLLDDLAYAYERLEKAQEKAFGTEYIDKYQQKLANLQSQYDAYEKQLEAEQSKGKKADDDKIDDYKKSMQEAEDAMEDMQTELSEHFLGTDLTSAARDFAQAWIEAYKEFSNTTDAMSDKFQDMIENMIVESFAAKVMQSALDPIFDEIDRMSKDGVLDMNEAAQVAGLAQSAISNIDVGMNNLMSALQAAGISVRGMGGDLTGISRDIATASEESILGLAAGINTQNYYISQVPAKMDVIIGLLRGEGTMAQGSAVTLQDLVTMQNQHLSYLPTIAQHTAETVAECKQIVVETRRTADVLERVVKPNGTQSTHKLNATLG